MKLSCISRLIIPGIFILLGSAKSYAQAVLPDRTGQPLTTKSYTNLEGSPFLVNDWLNGMVKLGNGNTFKDVPLKYNELEDVLCFKSSKGEELMFAVPVQEFTLPVLKNGNLQQRHFRNGYTGGNPKAFYEVLSDGGVQLLKRSSKVIQEDKEYNSATVNQKIIESIKYYLLVADKMISLKKDKKFILNALGNKQEQLEAYITSNNLNLKDDNDLAKLINYYNSI